MTLVHVRFSPDTDHLTVLRHPAAGASSSATTAEAPAARRISGMVAPYWQSFDRYGQSFVFPAGALRLPDDLSTVKLLMEHDPERPVGYADSSEQNDDGLYMAFTLPDFPRGTAALEELELTLRDGFSVGVELDSEIPENDGETIPLTGLVREVSLVSVPQFNNARASLALSLENGNNTMTTPALPTLSEAISSFTITEAPEFLELAGRVNTLERHSPAGAHSLARFGSLAEAILAGVGPEPARIALVLADNTSNAGKNAGVMPPGWLTSVVGIIAQRRAVIEAFGGAGSLPDNGMNISWPYFDGDISALVGEQATQKSDITSVAVDIKAATAPVKTYAGGADNALQLIERSSPSFLEAWGRIMAAAYAVVTDAAFTAVVEAGATGTDVPVDWTSSDSIRGAVFAASDAVDDATGAPASFVLASSDVFAKVGALPDLYSPEYGTNNAAGVASAATLRVDVNGLPFIKAKALPANTALASNATAARFLEDGPSFIDALNVTKLGRDSAIYGYGSSQVYIGAGIVPLFDSPV